MAGRFEQVHGAFDVDALVQRRFFEAGPDSGARRQVNDLVELRGVKQCTHRRAIREIALDKCESFSERRDLAEVAPLDFGIVEGIEIVEGRHRMARAQQPPANMRADKPGAARHQKIHALTLTTRDAAVECSPVARPSATLPNRMGRGPG